MSITLANDSEESRGDSGESSSRCKQGLQGGEENDARRSIGGIDEGQRRHLPALAAGQAIVSFTTLTRPLQVTIDPTPCKLLLLD